MYLTQLRKADLIGVNGPTKFEGLTHIGNGQQLRLYLSQRVRQRHRRDMIEHDVRVAHVYF